MFSFLTLFLCNGLLLSLPHPHPHSLSLSLFLSLFLSFSPRLPEIDSALQVLSEILQQLTNQKSSIEGDIHTTFDELQKTLNVRKSVLLMELEVNYGLKQKVRAQLQQMCDNWEEILVQICRMV